MTRRVAEGVCGSASSLNQETDSPTRIVKVAGSNREPAIRTDVSAGAVGPAPMPITPPGPEPQPEAQPEFQLAGASTPPRIQARSAPTTSSAAGPAA